MVNTGGCCGSRLGGVLYARCGSTRRRRHCAVRFPEVKHGPPGGGRGGRGSRRASGGSTLGSSGRRQRAAARVNRSSSLICGGLRGASKRRNVVARRLNAHLSSIVSSRRSSFRMPVEVVARAGRSDVMGGLDQGTSRLSSFGFSGTIAHGAFASPTTSYNEGGAERSGRPAYSYFRSALAYCKQIAVCVHASCVHTTRVAPSTDLCFLALGRCGSLVVASASGLTRSAAEIASVAS